MSHPRHQAALAQGDRFVRNERAQHQRAAVEDVRGSAFRGAEPGPQARRTRSRAATAARPRAQRGRAPPRPRSGTGRRAGHAEQREQGEVVRATPAAATRAAGSAAPTARRRSAPRRAGRRCRSRLRWIAVQLSAAASGTASAIAVPARWRASTAASSCAYIQAMPTPATTIAAQVRSGRRWPSTTRANKRGQERRDRHRHEHVGDRRHRDRDHERGEHHRPAQARKPERRIGAGQRLPPALATPRRRASRTTSASALKTLRQNVASKPLAESRWRVTTPAMLQSSVATSIASDGARVRRQRDSRPNSRRRPTRARGCRTW